MYRDELEAVRAERDALKTDLEQERSASAELKRLNAAHVKQICELQRGFKAEVWDRAKPWFILVPVLVIAFAFTVYMGVRSHRAEDRKTTQRYLRLTVEALKDVHSGINDCRKRVRNLETAYSNLIE